MSQSLRSLPPPFPHRQTGVTLTPAPRPILPLPLLYSSIRWMLLTHASYEVKRTVENYILKLPIGHTFLRPVQFMENYLPTAPFLFRMGRTVVMRFTFYEHPERKHQLIASRDIGEAGAKAFIEGPEWMGGVVRLAGWEGTVKEIDQIFKEVSGAILLAMSSPKKKIVLTRLGARPAGTASVRSTGLFRQKRRSRHARFGFCKSAKSQAQGSIG